MSNRPQPQVLTFADADTLQEYTDDDTPAADVLLSVAVTIGATRLIDNVVLPFALKK